MRQSIKYSFLLTLLLFSSFHCYSALGVIFASHSSRELIRSYCYFFLLLLLFFFHIIYEIEYILQQIEFDHVKCIESKQSRRNLLSFIFWILLLQFDCLFSCSDASRVLRFGNDDLLALLEHFSQHVLHTIIIFVNNEKL